MINDSFAAMNLLAWTSALSSIGVGDNTLHTGRSKMDLALAYRARQGLDEGAKQWQTA
jgi:hypothetical protein